MVQGYMSSFLWFAVWSSILKFDTVFLVEILGKFIPSGSKPCYISHVWLLFVVVFLLNLYEQKECLEIKRVILLPSRVGLAISWKKKYLSDVQAARRPSVLRTLSTVLVYLFARIRTNNNILRASYAMLVSL